ncbi:type i inorganic pyrophosphatase ppase, partial [Cystoisospora suis]
IDKGELDWKVLAIRQGDPLFSKLRNGLQDVERYCPGVISGIREWFRWYKLPTDNTLSLFGHEERAVSAEVAREVVLHAHHHYIVFLKAEKERRLKKLHKGPELQEGKQKRLTDDESIDEKALSSFWIPLRE